MSNFITTNLKTLTAQQIYNLLDSYANSYLPDARKSNMYLVIGRQIPWNTGTEIVPSPGQTPNQIFEYYRRSIAAKKLTYNNASFVIPRRDWTTGTVYRQYDCACNLMDIYMDFYVKNSDDQVFKCLFNNNGVPSIHEPSLSLSSTSLEEPYLKTNDGYKWKYMYTISSVQKQKFMTSEWMPVYYDKFVRSNAVDGSIDIIQITNSGNNYTSGSVQDIITVIGDGTGAVLKANVSSGTLFLSGTANVSNISIEVVGTGTLFQKEISVGTSITLNEETKTVIQVNSNTSILVDSVFEHSNNNIAATKSGGNIIDVVIQDRGKNYTQAQLVFVDTNGGIGTGANATVKIVPQNGHGYDPVYELYSKTLMITVDIDRDENGVFPTDNDYREILMIHNPYEYGTNILAENDTYTLYTKIKVSPGIGNFSNDEIVYQGETYATSTFSAEVISFDEVSNTLYLNNIIGSLETNQTIKGYSTGSIRVAVSSDMPTMKPYSGKILYVSDRTMTQRDPDQLEKFRIILSF